jgi:pre-mRNA-splicing factor ATP-dependent RNA helicase DHX15/PRP43
MVNQKASLFSRPKSDPCYSEQLKKCILSGFFMQAAMRQKSQSYITVKEEQVVALHPSCALDFKPEWVVYNEFVQTNRQYIRTVMAIEPEWLLQAAPDCFDLDEVTNTEIKLRLQRVMQRLN